MPFFIWYGELLMWNTEPLWHMGNGRDECKGVTLEYGQKCLDEFSEPLIGAELGIAWGGCVQDMAKLWLGRGIIYGYDTFEGHPKHLSDNVHSAEARALDWTNQKCHKLSIEYQRFQLDKQGLDNARLVKGIITEFSCTEMDKLHYCFLDMDMLESMVAGYAAVKNKIVEGGYLLIHDYHLFPRIRRWVDTEVITDPIWTVDGDFPNCYLFVLKRN